MEIIGHRIVAARLLSKKEMADAYWHGEQPPVALVLDNGIILYPSRDEEGNGPGTIFGDGPDGYFTLYWEDAR